MSSPHFLALAGIGLTIFTVAAVSLAIFVLALLAAATSNFFRSVDHFDSELREATMDLAPDARRRFFEFYDSPHPKSPAVAWFLAVGLGPIGANLYRAKWYPFWGAAFTLNGLGAWWLESIFTTPYLVAIDNRARIAFAKKVVDEEFGAEPAITVQSAVSNNVEVAA